MIVFNAVGATMGLFAFLIALGVTWLIGIEGGGPGLLIGALCILFDVSYRVHTSNGHWVIPWCGGHVMFIPLWIIGVVFMGVAGVDIVSRPALIGRWGGLVIGILVAASIALTILQLFLVSRQDPSHDSSEPPPPEVNNGVVRCPECKMPSDVKKLEFGGSCPWCGAHVMQTRSSSASEEDDEDDEPPRPRRRRRADDGIQRGRGNRTDRD